MKEKCSFIPWGLRAPIWKINCCFRVLRLSVLPWCRKRPQPTICCLTAVNSFHPALKYEWEISDTSLAFLDVKVSIRRQRFTYELVCTTSPQILIVICCNHLHIHHMSRIPFLNVRSSHYNFALLKNNTLHICPHFHSAVCVTCSGLLTTSCFLVFVFTVFPDFPSRIVMSSETFFFSIDFHSGLLHAAGGCSGWVVKILTTFHADSTFLPSSQNEVRFFS